MRSSRGRTVDVASLAELDHRLAAGARSLSGWRVRSLDLTGHTDALRRCRLAGATFLGCTFAPGAAAEVEEAGALVLPQLPDTPLDVYRGDLYSPAELYDTLHWPDSLDGRGYAWVQGGQDGGQTGGQGRGAHALAETLHDHAIDEALGRWREGRRLVGVMGGHRAERGDATYRDAARLGRLLADPDGAVLTVATGGGPGAMEAANLGARLASYDAAVLDEALTALARVPTYRPSIDAWALAAFDVVARWPDATPSLGIPTWHYGHEPPGAFATAVAKYVRNATREAILLEVCDAGIVFLPGAGGTVQEVFQDACENYYADEASVAPMVLVGERYWTEDLPVWPLLRALARGRAMEPHVHLVDTVEEAAAVARRDDAPGQPR